MKTLTKEQYYRWLHKIEEMRHAETTLKFINLQHGMLEKDLEIQRLRIMIFKNQIDTKKQILETVKKEYEDIKAELEKDLDMSLNNCVIDDVTFEVKKLDE